MALVDQVAGCYPAQSAAFPGQLISLLDTHYAAMSPSLRTSVVKALILLRHRNQVCLRGNAGGVAARLDLYSCLDMRNAVACQRLTFVSVLNRSNLCSSSPSSSDSSGVKTKRYGI